MNAPPPDQPAPADQTIIEVPRRPHMPAEAVALLEAEMRSAGCFLEYGAGGSTRLAAGLGIDSVFSVESDEAFAGAVKRAVEEDVSAAREGGAAVPRNLVLTHVDLGPTKAWGTPATLRKCAQWPHYPINIWAEIRQRKVSPDLILIDGRFRVACFIASIIRAREGTTILFDDYADRKFYRHTSKYLPIERMADRMAVFRVRKTFSLEKAAFDLAKFCMDAR